MLQDMVDITDNNSMSKSFKQKKTLFLKSMFIIFTVIHNTFCTKNILVTE